MRPRAAPTAIGALALLAGCYATTPHRAEVTASGARATCDGAVTDVMTRAGLVALMPPAHYSMFFGPRSASPGATLKTTAIGVGVVIKETAGDTGAGNCSVTLEAISTDPSCAALEPPECDNQYLRWAPGGDRSNPATPNLSATCGAAMACDMSEAPGHEQAIDDFARRLRDTLGPSARVVAARAN